MTNEKVSRSLVVGGTGLVGGYIVRHLMQRGEQPLAMSRKQHEASDVQWVCADLRNVNTLAFDCITTIYCTADAALLATALPRLISPVTKRVVAFSSTSVLTKQDSEVLEEREMIRKLRQAEETIISVCQQSGVDWTILRPTLIYAEGRDTNITPLSKLIQRFHFMPLVGGGTGLRQPVHAEDLAIGAINAAGSALAANRFYSLPGGEAITYREMVGRIFDGLGMPRCMFTISPTLWRAAFVLAKPLYPNANVAMGIRMTTDMSFDIEPAQSDFGWKPRLFRPRFDV